VRATKPQQSEVINDFAQEGSLWVIDIPVSVEQYRRELYAFSETCLVVDGKPLRWNQVR